MLYSAGVDFRFLTRLFAFLFVSASSLQNVNNDGDGGAVGKVVTSGLYEKTIMKGMRWLKALVQFMIS